MKRVLSWITAAVVVVPLLWLMLVASVHWSGPTAEQRTALMLLKPDPHPAGRNAFAALWLMRYQVPEEQIEALAAADIEAFMALPIDLERPSFERAATGRYREFPGFGVSDPRYCKVRESACLSKVREAAGELHENLAPQRDYIARVEALSDYDYYREGFPPRPDLSTLSLGYPGAGQAMLWTDIALDYLHGRAERALQRACANHAAWRRIGDDTDSLIVAMLSSAYQASGARLIAELLAEVPREVDLPTACAAALSPPSATETSVCRAMRFEFEFGMSHAALITEGSSFGKRSILPLVYDTDLMRSWIAPHYAFACGDTAREMRERDIRFTPAHFPDVWPGWLRCAGSAATCWLNRVASEVSWSDYLNRKTDAAARQRLLATVAWLRGNTDPSLPLKQRLATLPTEFRTATRLPEPTTDGRELRVSLWSPRDGESSWSLPVATSQ
jgi:hypothetical protein